ncbi:30S ribosomal protein S5 [symbiont of Argiope bruennichi]|uniref:30S ribosomal protein S5 n=1 Tax=symbiont of Argiope bruennichi TaxID=2810479 RepID=UPI003DA4EA11
MSENLEVKQEPETSVNSQENSKNLSETLKSKAAWVSKQKTRTLSSQNQPENEFRVIKIKRIVKVVKGGRRFRFSSLVVNGDGKYSVGYANSKSQEIPNAVKKANNKAVKNYLKIPVNKDESIFNMVIGKCGASMVLLKPASKGTGIIAGGPVRTIFQIAGIKNIYSKCYGSRNQINIIRATFNAIEQLIKIKKLESVKVNLNAKQVTN